MNQTTGVSTEPRAIHPGGWTQVAQCGTYRVERTSIPTEQYRVVSPWGGAPFASSEQFVARVLVG